MIQLLRSLFGLNGAAGNRKVVGSPDGMEVKDVPYMQESNQRLVALQELYNRFRNTAHAPKLQAVYEKTKRIHTYLAARSRGHELELFHVQHTDHFLSAFTAIMDAHQEPQVQVSVPPPPRPSQPPQPTPKPDVMGRTLVIGPFRSDRKEVKTARTLNRQTSHRAYMDTTEANVEVPRLGLPEISINTYSQIVYLREDVSDGLTTNEIGFTSTPEEKATFEAYVSARFGLKDVTYVGNAMVYIPTHNSNQPAEIVPVIHWHGAPYVLSLEDNRLYPVSTYRKRW
ncbi:hypothetical protein POKO110462_11530 [Pontibacter korlensis]|uniref:Uncharacterized protein n=1 Tax=Pontibacter korlensis TaxID=400092 RepID=A0A0E3UXE7_9BACT|nr:hypothetical protein [Pontibacter korlensis]AKD04197.1 hypothetical protein PKOR_15245 [Pontibacter korlensis]